MVKSLGNNCENMRVKKRVIDSLSFPAVLDQTVLFEYTELVGNSALRHVEFIGDVVDAFFMVEQCIQDLQPGWRTEYFK